MKKWLIPAALFAASLLVSCHRRPFERAAERPDGGCRLEQVVVLSRHNIRTPLTLYGSVLDSITPHGDMWHDWSVPSGELTLKGAVSETMMGQYFRLWLEDEGLIPVNWQPCRREAFFYANSLQRTVATARCFASGMMPAADIRIKYKPGILDVNFLPILWTSTDAFRAEAAREREDVPGKAGFDSLARGFAVMERILDYENSPYYKVHEEHLSAGPVEVFDEQGLEPRIKGVPRAALSASDALVLQFYEEQDPLKAAFGHEVSIEDWKSISDIKEVYMEHEFAVPVVCAVTGRGAIRTISSELGCKGRLFSFLCGHDSTILSVLTALGVEPFELEDSIEKNTPIGSKLLFERWSVDGEQRVRLRLVYPRWRQLKELPPITLENPPGSCVLNLKGLDAKDGAFYRLEDIRKRMKDAVNAGKAASEGIAPGYLL